MGKGSAAALTNALQRLRIGHVKPPSLITVHPPCAPLADSKSRARAALVREAALWDLMRFKNPPTAEEWADLCAARYEATTSILKTLESR